MRGNAPSHPGMPGIVATPSPTTLGSATGQIQVSRSKAGYIVAGLVIAAMAIAAIIAVVGKDKGIGAAGGGSEGSALVASGSESGTTGTGATGAGTTGAGATGTTGTGATETTGAGTTRIGATGTGANGTTGTGATGTGATGTAATGTGTTGTGANGATGTGATGTGATGTGTTGTGTSSTGGYTIPDETEIGVSSSPSGARIYVDNVDTGKITPAKLNVPRKRAKSISITLRLKGYEQFTFKSVDVSEASQQKAELVKVKTASHPSSRCRTPDRPGCKRDYDDCCLPEAGSGKPPGTKQGSAAGSAASDRDDLMRP
jgi:hypothetical protein